MTQIATGWDSRVNGREHKTDGLWTHTGRLVVTQGPVDLPDGSIGLAELIPGAATALVGSYQQALSWTVPTPNTWNETPIQIFGGFTGAVVRFSLNFLVSCPTKGQRVLWDIMLDGVRGSDPALGAADAPENAFAVSASGTYYALPSTLKLVPPTPGSHRASIALYGPSGTQIMPDIWSTLYVTEERR